jgi:hypothetical protein
MCRSLLDRTGSENPERVQNGLVGRSRGMPGLAVDPALALADQLVAVRTQVQG